MKRVEGKIHLAPKEANLRICRGPYEARTESLKLSMIMPSNAMEAERNMMGADSKKSFVWRCWPMLKMSVWCRESDSAFFVDSEIRSLQGGQEVKKHDLQIPHAMSGNIPCRGKQ